MRFKKALTMVIATFISFSIITSSEVKKVDANVVLVNVSKEQCIMGNDYGNISKGGNVAYKNGYIYYSFLKTLYKKNEKTNEITKLCENSFVIAYINVTDEGIYTVDLGENDETSIVHRDLNGKNEKVIAKGPARQLMVCGKYIYYVGVKENTEDAVIRRMNLDGSNNSIFYEPEIPVGFNNYKDSIAIVGNYILLQYSDRYKIIDIKTSKYKEHSMKCDYLLLDYALKNGDLYINVVPSYNYFPKFPFKPELRRINLNENKDELLSDEAIYFQIINDDIYYFTLGELAVTDGLYKMDFNGQNKSLVKKTDRRLVYKGNGKLYYIENRNGADVVEIINKQ